ncbi:unnamed protein product [Parascedosporium putredinis]|uniref:PWI domain-containing protein n=1 Tax=Parascedosporium putredinis TaxID=1442378 RepID=A0A9P1H1I1_9PEZI|nr:unnamed protein product [Parascedosporium putredinis]CAI7995199.1 unnamed protein product [Parascedosporium putredinis]
MSYNPYGPPPGYGPPPSYGGFPGAGPPAGMVPPPGLGPPPGMSSAPGMAPPGMHQPSATQANRPSGLPANFQAPEPSQHKLQRQGNPPRNVDPETEYAYWVWEEGGDHGRSSMRESTQSFIPFSHEERLRTIFVHKIPGNLAGDIEKVLNAVGKVRRWDSAASVLLESTGTKFGFALYDDAESFANAVELLKDIEVPAKPQPPREPEDEPKDDFEGIDKARLQISVDENSVKYVESYRESRAGNADATSRTESAKAELQRVIKDLFYPPPAKKIDRDGDTSMQDSNRENVEVVNIPLTQEDELADIPAEMREIVAGEIAAFRERSNKRDLERMKKEEEMEEMERTRSNRVRSPRPSSPGGTNNIPLGPRGLQNVPSGPKGQNGYSRGVTFVNGEGSYEGDDTDASDEEIQRRQSSKQKREDDQVYSEAERKWVNREKSRAAALSREKDREKQEAESLERRRQEQLEREKAWDDERRWRERATSTIEITQQDDETRRETAELERTRGLADSFLDRQAKEMEQREAASAPQPFKLSLGAAAQRAQAQRAVPQRRTIAEVEGLLDDEEQDQTTKRQLIPIQFEPSTTSSMTEEELSKAMRALAQEIPSEKEGLWAWDVQWDHLDDAIMREKLRPFVEKKIVEYLGVQEEVIVEVIEEHLRNHGKPDDLVEELAGALDDEAEDLVKSFGGWSSSSPRARSEVFPHKHSLDIWVRTTTRRWMRF